MNDLGTTYRKIRKSRGITQAQVCKDLLSRTTLSKFENEKLTPSVTLFIALLARIDCGFDEFFFIAQGYRLTEKQQILHQFFSLFSNQKPKALLALKEQCLLFQRTSVSKTIDLLVYVIDSLTALSTNTEKEIPCLPKVLLTVPWDALQAYSDWTLDDIKLINCLLYLFPVETAHAIANQLIQQLKKYEALENTVPLQCAIHLNVALLYLQEQQHQEAKESSDQALLLAKKSKRYDYYSLATARKSFAIRDSDLFAQARQMASLFEDKWTCELIEKEGRLFLG